MRPGTSVDFPEPVGAVRRMRALLGEAARDWISPAIWWMGRVTGGFSGGRGCWIFRSRWWFRRHGRGGLWCLRGVGGGRVGCR